MGLMLRSILPDTDKYRKPAMVISAAYVHEASVMQTGEINVSSDDKRSRC